MNKPAVNLFRVGFSSEGELPSTTYLQQSALMQTFIKNKIERKTNPKKTKISVRSLSKRELNVALELTFLSTSFINRLDEVQSTSLYSKEVKSAVNTLSTELEQYTHRQMWSQIEGKQASINTIEQCDLGSQFVDRMLRVTTLAQEFDQAKFEAYVNAIEAVNKQFGLTLLWKHDDPKA
ncbi:hypothetical protein BWI93_10145 [Siphonobacter sp. BAB-5385]|uniref:hypothetical protein n=1 Tax=Siphonobacter sp. BAB-5385 TaxID=1864822 RepID=UPI000B9DD815|nr:hypothetical protein [Siphonobacter sp. BAB-5385]OZI08218.1 hypothetical protein BWI93_10145 [Siphonobacter sp. BAB-5385]